MIGRGGTGPAGSTGGPDVKRDNKNRLWASVLWLGTVLIAWRCFIPYAIGETLEHVPLGILIVGAWWAGMILLREKIDWFDKE